MYSSTYHQPTTTTPFEAHLQEMNELDCLSNTIQQQQRHDSMDYSRRQSYFTGLLGSHSEASYSDGEQQTPSPFNSYEDYQYHHPLDNNNSANNKRRLSTLVELPHIHHGHVYGQGQLVYPPTPAAANGWMPSSVTTPPATTPQRCNSSPMIYAHPSVDMYSPQTYFSHPGSNYNGYHPLCNGSTTPMLDNANTTMIMTAAATIPSDGGIYRERASSSSSFSSSSDGGSLLSSVSPPMSRRTSKVPSAAAAAAAAKSLTKPTRSRGRRVSNSPSIAGQKVFTCKHDDCGKVFKRSEHLKRHVRSIHTLEKPFECPYQSCSKRFSRSDNLNQHIRIHRHTGKDKHNNNNSVTNGVTTTTTPTISRNNSFSNYMPTY